MPRRKHVVQHPQVRRGGAVACRTVNQSSRVAISFGRAAGMSYCSRRQVRKLMMLPSDSDSELDGGWPEFCFLNFHSPAMKASLRMSSSLTHFSTAASDIPSRPTCAVVVQSQSFSPVQSSHSSSPVQSQFQSSYRYSVVQCSPVTVPVQSSAVQSRSFSSVQSSHSSSPVKLPFQCIPVQSSAAQSQSFSPVQSQFQSIPVTVPAQSSHSSIGGGR
eukprot:1053364-Prorocentrum_minimum.AAC.6